MNTANKKLQSAMEYLMTYGWAILIVAVVIGVLYALGIFNGAGLLGSFCTAQTGYFCANPILSTNSPTLNVTIGQDTRLEWPAWKIFAARGTAFNASSPNITGSGAFYNGEKQIVTIPLNNILGNYIPIGTPFSGSLWAEYCNTPNCNTPNQVSEIGIFYTKAAKLGYVTTSVSTTSLSTTSTPTTSTATTAPTTTTIVTTFSTPGHYTYNAPSSVVEVEVAGAAGNSGQTGENGGSSSIQTYTFNNLIPGQLMKIWVGCDSSDYCNPNNGMQGFGFGWGAPGVAGEDVSGGQGGGSSAVCINANYLNNEIQCIVSGGGGGGGSGYVTSTGGSNPGGPGGDSVSSAGGIGGEAGSYGGAGGGGGGNSSANGQAGGSAGGLAGTYTKSYNSGNGFVSIKGLLSVLVSPTSVSAPSGTTFTLTANVFSGTSPYSYQWYNATSGTGILIHGATSPTYTATAGSTAGAFDYYVKVTDSESPPQTAYSLNSVVSVPLPPSGITYYVPITLSNSQSVATPSPFQQMVNITENPTIDKYLTYNGNFANFEFFTSTGSVIPAWIESNSLEKLTTWVKLPNGIPAESSIIIYLGFASTSNNLLSSSGTTGIGEAPQLPCGSTPTSSCSTYAEYDDGAGVFNFYDNFAGTSLNTKWTTSPSGTIGIAVSNSITLTEAGSSNGYAQTLSSFGSDVLEFYGKMYLNGGTSTIYCDAGSGYSIPNAAGTNTGIISAGCPSSSQKFITNTGSTPIATATYQTIWSIAYGGSSAATSYLYNNYLQLASLSDTNTNYPAPFGFFIQANSGWAFFAQWARVRAYPPNGVMPSALFGNVITV